LPAGSSLWPPGAPFLFATEAFWARRAYCPECGDLGRRAVEQIVEADQLHRELLGHGGVVR